MQELVESYDRPHFEWRRQIEDDFYMARDTMSIAKIHVSESLKKLVR